MPWTCRLVGRDAYPKIAGDMYYADLVESEQGAYCEEGRLSEEYLRLRRGHRPPLILVLPGHHAVRFGIDTCVSGERHGWTVDGEPPRITVSPSINLVGYYHGFLVDGVLSDDLESR